MAAGVIAQVNESGLVGVPCGFQVGLQFAECPFFLVDGVELETGMKTVGA